MKLYHASTCIIESPDVYHSRDLLDFGKGFYLTKLRSLLVTMKNGWISCLYADWENKLNQEIIDKHLRFIKAEEIK